VARRARRTGSVFWGCSRYPACDFTTSREPLGAVHDADDGPVARADAESGLCLRCGAAIPLAGEVLEPGRRLAGGEPNPAALARPAARRGGRGRAPASTRGRRTTTKRAGAAPPA
jgi:hypothetical protein